MHILRFCFFFVLLSGFSKAQEYPLDQSSPQSTLYKHYYYLSEGNYHPAIAAQTFGSSEKADQQLAIWLKQIFDGKGLVPRFETFPSNKNYLDSTSHLNEYQPFDRYPEIILQKKGIRWYFSPRTKEYIPKLHQQIFPFGSGWLMNLIPDRGGEQFLGLKAWQWVGVFLLLLTAILLHKLFTWIIERITRRLIQSSVVTKIFRIAIHKMAIPLSYLFMVLILDWLFPSLLLPIGFGKIVNMIFRIAEPVFLSIALYKFVDVIALILKRRAEKTETTLDDQLVPLFRKFFKALIVIFGVLLLLKNLDFNLTALIAGVSIGGLALALAAQDTIKNMFGSLMIFIDRPFHIGDLVALEGVTGKIEEVGFRSTRIRTLTHSLVSIPNGKVMDMVIDNLGHREYRRFQTNITITYDTPPERIEAFVKGIRTIASEYPTVKQDDIEVSFNDLTPSALNIILNIHFHVKEWTQELEGRQEILLRIMKLAETMEVKFAFPSQSIYLENFNQNRTITDS